MALINCPECSKNISDKAPSCPDCGYPVSRPLNSGANYSAPVTTIEQTGKKWKQLQLIAAGLILGGILFALLGFPTFAAIIFFLGLGTIIYAGFGSWWQHS